MLDLDKIKVITYSSIVIFLMAFWAAFLFVLL